MQNEDSLLFAFHPLLPFFNSQRNKSEYPLFFLPQNHENCVFLTFNVQYYTINNNFHFPYVQYGILVLIFYLLMVAFFNDSIFPYMHFCLIFNACFPLVCCRLQQTLM